MIDSRMPVGWPEDNPPWDRQAWDTPGSYDAFRRYYLPLPPARRSLITAYRNFLTASGKDPGSLKAVPGRWRYWSYGQDDKGFRPAGSRFEKSLTWMQRAAAFDAIADREQEDALLEQRREWRKKELALADLLYQRTLDMSAFPLAETRTEEDGELAVTVVSPADWDQDTMLRAAKLAVDLARRALNMPTEKTGEKPDLDWRKGLAKHGIDAGELFNQLVSAIAIASGTTANGGATESDAGGSGPDS